MVKLSEATEISAVRLKEQSAFPTVPAALGDIVYKSGKFYGVDDTNETEFSGGGLGVAQTAATELTLDAAGAITLTQGVHRIDTFANAASDDLDTIAGGVTDALYLLYAEDAGRTVRIRPGAGNIRSFDGVPIVLDDVYKNVLLRYNGSTYNVIGTVGNPNEMQDWGAYPDSDVYFAAQDAASGDFYRIRGDEMRAAVTWIITGDVSGNSDSLMSVLFNTSTAATFTIATSSPLEGHEINAQALQVQVGTPHKILLPTGVYWGASGTNRAALISLTSDRLIKAICHNLSGTLRYIPYDDSGITYAAS